MPSREVPSRIVLATRNPDKVKEIRAIFRGFVLPIVGLEEYPSVSGVEETGVTLEANALLKARHAWKAAGQIALADDSGLFVRALGGGPGVFSSRFAGVSATYADNVAKLLRLMEGRAWAERGAAFICMVALVMDEGEFKLFRGEVGGVISEEPIGRHGFGYDPVFFHPPSRKTFAQLSRLKKNRISHRSIAFRAAREYLEESFGL